jgi:hypothetical protein
MGKRTKQPDVKVDGSGNGEGGTGPAPNGTGGEATGSAGRDETPNGSRGVAGQTGGDDGGQGNAGSAIGETRSPESDAGTGPAPKRNKGRPPLTDAERAERAAARAAAGPKVSADKGVSSLASKADFIRAAYGIHKTVAQMFPPPVRPIVELSPAEAEAVGGAVYNVADEFGLAKYFTGKKSALGGLALVVVIIYIPKFKALKAASIEMQKAAVPHNPNMVDTAASFKQETVQ